MYRNLLIRWIMTYQVNSNIWHFKQLGSGVLLYSAYMGTGDIFLGVALRWSSNNPWDMYFLLLQSGRVKHTPQDCINEFIIQSLNPSIIGSCNNKISVPLRTLQASALCSSHHLSEPLTKELFHKSLPPVQLQLLGKTLKVKIIYNWISYYFVKPNTS